MHQADFVDHHESISCLKCRYKCIHSCFIREIFADICLNICTDRKLQNTRRCYVPLLLCFSTLLTTELFLILKPLAQVSLRSQLLL